MTISGPWNVVGNHPGNLGIGTTTPTASLHATGNIYASNALTTTNIFATGNVTVGDLLTVGGVPGFTSLNVTGNIYVSNAVTSTTHYGNVSASNVVVTPATGVTGINVTGNIYASNALMTTNVFATGSVGVGTTTPQAALDVAGSGIFSGTIGATTLNATGNVYVSNAVTTTNVYLISGVTNSTAGQIVKGALEFNGTSNVFYGTSSTIRGLIPVQYFYQLNADTALGTTASVTLVPAFPGMVNGVQLQNGKYYMKMIHILTITTSATAGNTSLNMLQGGGTSTTILSTGGFFSQNITSTIGIGSTASAQSVNTIYITGTTIERISAITTAVSTSTTYYTTIEGTFAIIAPGGWYPIAQMTSPGTFTATPGVRRGSFIYLQKIGDNAADVNIGGWS